MSTNTRESRIKQFGIDCGNGLLWTSWEPGGEYTQILNIRNVTTTSKHVKYQLPKTKFFAMQFPEMFTLSPGVSCSLAVTFRPVEKEAYTDHIEFTTEEGVFNVEINAVLPAIGIEALEFLDVGDCAVKEVVKKNFSLSNTGKVPVSFSWSVEGPFALTPARGTLQPAHKVTIAVRFLPLDASTQISRAICTAKALDTAVPIADKTIQTEFTGVGKHSFLAVSTNVMEFGELFAGSTTEQTLVVENRSEVRSSFAILRENTRGLSSSFSFVPSKGAVDPGDAFPVKVLYRASAAGFISADTFVLKTPGGASARIQCRGSDVGPNVRLGSKIVDFGDVSVGETSKRAITIHNQSKIGAPFKLVTDPDTAFHFAEIAGVVPPGTSRKLAIIFEPKHPSNYYRRLFCLFEGAQPTFVELIGSGYTSEVRPAPMTARHIERFHKRIASGLSKYPPEMLAGVLADLGGDADDVAVDAAEPIKEFFLSDSDSVRDVFLVEDTLDFGPRMREAARNGQISQDARITNTTRGKVTALWVCPMANGTQPFRVHPMVSDILPGETMIFKVIFEPLMDDQFYGQRLECYVSYKTMRTFRLVTDETFCPPYHLTLRAFGHTFRPGAERFLPKLAFELHKGRLVFPPCRPGGVSYQTVRLSNNGDTPVKFVFDEGDFKSSGFDIKPLSGVLRGGEFELLVCRYSPTGAGTVEGSAKCIVNNSAANALALLMTGTCCEPSAELGTNQLYFKPTSIGAKATRTLRVRNTGGLPVHITWSIPDKYATVFGVEPAGLTLEGKAESTVEWTFAPAKERTSRFKARCFVGYPNDGDVLGGPTSPPAVVPLQIVAQGAFSPDLIFEPSTIDLGSVPVNTTVKAEVTIFNPSDCDVTCTMEGVKNTGETTELHSSLKRGSEFQLSAHDLVVRARSYASVTLSFCPKSRCDLAYKVVCSMELPTRLESGAVSREARRLDVCEAKATGTLPLLRVSDAYMEETSKSVLWERLAFDALNNELVKNITPAELDFLDAKGLVMDADRGIDLISPLPSFHLDVGARTENAPPSAIFMELANTGVVPAEWSLLLPGDVGAGVPEWSTTGEMKAEQLRDCIVLNEKLLSVTPRKGKLKPGEKTVVEIVFKHVVVGTHLTPAILSIAGGKQLVLNVSGRTMAKGAKFLHLHNTEHEFQPIPIGEENPCYQTFRLINLGEEDVEFELDLSNLAQLVKDNYDFEVFKCLSVGRCTVQTRKSFAVMWMFRPLEAKEYVIEVPLNVVGSDEPPQVLVFRGKGYHPSVMDLAPPPETSAPLTQSLMRKDQLAMLALERIPFGAVPMYSVNRRLIVVTNMHASHRLSFVWSSDYAGNFDSAITISPESGMLEPGENIVCKVTFIPVTQPHIIDFDLTCKVTDETLLDMYATGAQPPRRKNQDEEPFVYTDNSQGVPARAAERAKKRASRKAARDAPVIPSRAPRSTTLARATQGTSGPQASQTLYCYITARTYVVEQFKSLYEKHQEHLAEHGETLTPDNTAALRNPSTFFLSKSTQFHRSKDKTVPPRASVSLIGQMESTPSDAENKSVASDVLAHLLQEIVLERHDIDQTITRIERAPVPFYSQLVKPPRFKRQTGSRSANPRRTRGFESGKSAPTTTPASKPGSSASARALDVPSTAMSGNVIFPLTPNSPLGSPFSEATEPSDDSEEMDDLTRAEGNLDVKVMMMEEFQELVEFVLEGTMFNTLEEAARGDLRTDLTAKPRRIAQNLQFISSQVAELEDGVDSPPRERPVSAALPALNIDERPESNG